MYIDDKAPLIASEEIFITAPILLIWDILTNVPLWPTWQKKITKISINGKFEKNKQFEWISRGLSIRSSVLEIQAPSLLVWSGMTVGTYAIHVWKLEQQGQKTKIVTEESMSGWLPLIMKISRPKFLRQSLRQSLVSLQTEAELQINQSNNS